MLLIYFLLFFTCPSENDGSVGGIGLWEMMEKVLGGFGGFFLGFWELGVYLFIYFMYSHLFSSIFLLFPSWGFGFVGFGIDGCKGEFFFFFLPPLSWFLFSYSSLFLTHSIFKVGY